MLENIFWKNLVHAITFYLQFLCVAGYLKRSSDTSKLIWICISLWTPYSLISDPKYKEIGMIKCVSKLAISLKFHLGVCTNEKLELKSDLSKKFVLFASLKAFVKMMKNPFYFILKALFVLKIFKFLSWHFGHAERTTWLGR